MKGIQRRKNRNALGLLSLLLFMMCLLAAGKTARAGPPFVTDDPEPVDFRNWEIDLPSVGTHWPGTWAGTLPQIEVDYGAVPNLQLHVIFPVAFSRQPGEKTERGCGDTEVGAKYRFVQEGKKRPMVGIFPLLELPTGSAARGLGSGHLQWFMPVWLQKSWGKWLSYGGGGYWINPGSGNRNYWLLGWELQNDITRYWMLAGEIFLTTPSAVDVGTQLNFNVGGQINFNDVNHVLFSVGRSLRGDIDTMYYLGYQLTFGPRSEANSAKSGCGASPVPSCSRATVRAPSCAARIRPGTVPQRSGPHEGR
jgi:hypothetical protein